MLRWFAHKIFSVTGWTPVGEVPNLPKAVFIAAPHTSNWDGFWFLVYKVALGVEVRFLAKDTLFWWPLGSILRSMGALPIDRDDPAALVSQLVDAFDREEQMFLALAPEGTRQHKPYWKSGFFRIAAAANVPIVLAFIDYGSKRLGIGITLPLDISITDTLTALREFYAPFEGRRPEWQSPIDIARD